jgi:hypothetical protein
MDYKYEYICKIKQPVLCELCNKSYAIGVMKKHKQTKMHIKNAKNHGVPSSWWFVGTKPDAFSSLVSTVYIILKFKWTLNMVSVMYNNDGGTGGARGCEAHEVK